MQLTIGKSFGGKFGAAAAVAAVAAILPGIVKETDEGTSRAEVQIAFGIAGASVAKMMGKGMVSSAVIGLIVANFAGMIHDVIVDEGSEQNHALKLAGVVFGGAIGFAIGGPLGAAIGASLTEGLITYFEKEDPKGADQLDAAIRDWATSWNWDTFFDIEQGSIRIPILN